MVLLDEIEGLLFKNSETTITVLKELYLLSIEWISSVFEKVSYELQSKYLWKESSRINFLGDFSLLKKILNI